MRLWPSAVAAIVLAAGAPPQARPAPEVIPSEVGAALREAQTALERIVARHPFVWQAYDSHGATFGMPQATPYRREVLSVYGQLGELYLLEGRDCARGYLLLAQHAAFEGNLAQARGTFEQGFSAAPSPDLAYGIGWCLLRQASPRTVSNRNPEQIGEAIAWFEKALTLDPDHALALNSLGHCHYWLAVLSRPHDGPTKVPTEDWPHHTQSALSAWTRYLQHNPPTAMLYYLMGELHHTRGEHAQTAHYWRQAFDMGRGPSLSQFVQLLERDLEDPKAAQALLEEAVRREHARGRAGKPAAERELAYFWLRHGRRAEAMRYFEERAAAHPSAEEFFTLGSILENAGKPAEALVWYRRARERNPPFAEALDRAIQRVTAKVPQQ